MAHEREALDIARAVVSIACGRTGRWREQAFALVIAHGLHIDSGAVGEISYTQKGSPESLTL